MLLYVTQLHTGDNMGSRSISFAILAVTVLALYAVPVGGLSADGAITVEDGLGETFSFDGPVDCVVSIGVGVTATVIGIGALDKMVVCDSYSKMNADPLFDPLRDLIDEGDVMAGGNLYSSGKEQLKVDIINVSDPVTGSFDRDSDVVFVTGSDAYRANVVPFLIENGFRNVMQWYEIGDYADLEAFAETISLVCNGNIHPDVESIGYTAEFISSTLMAADVEPVHAFYVTYSAGVFKVGNTGSIANSMIGAAGGISVTTDDDRPQSTYETNLTVLVGEYPSAVVFADHSIVSDDGNLSLLRKAVGDGVTIVPLEAMWNNYSLESVEGVWTMACAMYPDLFEGDVPTAGGSGSDVVTYLGLSSVFVAVILLVSYMYMRKR